MPLLLWRDTVGLIVLMISCFFLDTFTRVFSGRDRHGHDFHVVWIVHLSGVFSLPCRAMANSFRVRLALSPPLHNDGAADATVARLQWQRPELLYVQKEM